MQKTRNRIVMLLVTATLSLAGVACSESSSVQFADDDSALDGDAREDGESERAETLSDGDKDVIGEDEQNVETDLAPSDGDRELATEDDETTPDGDVVAESEEAAEAEVEADTDAVALEKFSFFTTSLKALRRLSGNQNGFGGDLRFGESGAGAGLRGADKICTSIAESSMPGSGAKGWRAFLSAKDDGTGKQVNAIERIGNGPWYDRLGRVLANNKAALLNTRPAGCDTDICNDFPNEYGVTNHNPDLTGNVDNHDMLTGSNAQGQLYGATYTCNDWTSTSKTAAGKPRVGHSWPRSGGPVGPGGMKAGPGGGEDMSNWISALTEYGCAPGVHLIDDGAGSNDGTVGGGGGYGGFYCFALTP